jgi:two-component sensor histidine kinase
MVTRLTFTMLLLASLCYSFGQHAYVRPIAALKTEFKKTTPDSTRARLLLDMALSYVYRPGEYPADLDSALLLIQQANDINSRLHDTYLEGKSCFVSSNTLREKGDVAHGIIYAQKAIRLLTATPWKLQLGAAYIELAQYYSIYTADDLTKKRQCWQSALVAFQATDSRERQAFALKNLGDVDYLMDNYGRANVELQQSLSIYTALGYPAVQGIYDLMGTISYCLGDYLGAVKNGLQAVKTAELVNDTTMQLCTICHRLASAYLAWSKEEESRFYRKKALDIAIKYKDQKAIYTVFADPTDIQGLRRHWQESIRLIDDIQRRFPPLELDDTVILYSSYTQAFTAGEEFAMAKKYADYLLALTKRNKNDYDKPLQPTFHCLVLYAAGAKLYPQMERFVDEYVKACRAISFPGGLPWAYMMKARADSGMGKYLSALQWYQLSKKMSDSMFNVTKSMQFSQMQVQYETEKKDKDLQLLTDKSQLQEMSLKKASLTRNIIIASAILLIALLYIGYKLKQRHNKKLQLLLEKEQKLVDEKEWLVREIHHRVKNNLQLVISLLNTQCEFLDDPFAFTAIKESRQRMQAIAIIHQKLYRPDENTLIDMASYIGEMIDYLKESFTNTDKILFRADVGPIMLDVSQAVPLGLIINEGVTNSVKYAFPGNGKGHITISLRQTEGRNIRLAIADDGQGFPASVFTGESSSMGIQLIKLFAEQLEGQLEFVNAPGAGITLNFIPSSP